MANIVPGVVLAAGRSSRMGRTKALLPAGPDGDTFVSRIVRTVREGGVDDVLVVVAPDASTVVHELLQKDFPPRLVINPTPELGQLSSVQCALRVIDHPGVAALLVTLVDVPLVSAATVRLLLDTHRRTHAPVVRPARGAKHGHPVIFDRSVFEELRLATTKSSMKAIVKAHLDESVDVNVDADGPFLDIDTPAEYESAFHRSLPNSQTTGNSR